MGNISIKRSLTLALAILVAMIAAISALGFYSNSVSSSVIDELREINVRQVNTINRAQVNLLNARVELGKYISLDQGGRAERVHQNVMDSLEKSRQRFAEFQQVELEEGSRRAPYVDAISSAYDRLVNDTLMPLMDGSSPDEIQARQSLIAQQAEIVDAAIRNFIHYAEQRGDELIIEDSESSRIVEISAIALLALALLAALAVRLGMLRVVVRPLQDAIDHFERIAGGDLTARIEDRGTNEIGKLFSALKNMQAKLSSLVLALRKNSDSVFIGAGEIATGSQDLSTRTEEQASALQETASSMEQMTSTVRQNTEAATEANQLSVNASKSAEEGGEEVERTVLLMREIASSSRKINEVVEVIDSIAFQTNILALNASVEAARAGEQGRGFAVVASEVRSLASRSADSAKAIRAMIEETTTQIVNGAEQAERSGKTISETVDSIRHVSALMSEISSATHEQNSGIEQINVAITQMDSVTQQNASLVEQTSAAAASLEEQAKQLSELIATFRVNDQAVHAKTVRSKATASRLPAPAAQREEAKASRLETAQEEWSEF